MRIAKYRLLGTGYTKERSVEPGFTGVEVYNWNGSKATYFRPIYVELPKLMDYNKFRYTYLEDVYPRKGASTVMDVYKDGKHINRFVVTGAQRLVHAIVYYILATLNDVDYYTWVIDKAPILYTKPKYDENDYWQSMMKYISHTNDDPIEMLRYERSPASIEYAGSWNGIVYIIGHRNNSYKCTYFALWSDMRMGFPDSREMHVYMDTGYPYVLRTRNSEKEFIGIGLIKKDGNGLKLLQIPTDRGDVIKESSLTALGKQDFIELELKRRHIELLGIAPGVNLTLLKSQVPAANIYEEGDYVRTT